MTDLQTAFASDDDSPGFLLWQVTNGWQAAQRAALAPFGITHVQFVLLASLTWHGSDEPVTQRALADHARTDPMMTSQVVRALEARGLVDRGPHPTDARARAVRATDDGRALANAAVAAVEDVDTRYFGPLGAGRAAFTDMLRRLATSGG